MGLFSWLSKKTATTPAPASTPAGEPGRSDEELPSSSLAELSEALSSSMGARRVDAARALLERWRAGDVEAAEAVAPRLGELLDDPEPLVRIAGLGGVRLLRRPENLAKHESAVLALLADPAAQVRTSAVWSAVRIPGLVARAQVHAVLQSGEEPMRFAAACALSDQHDAAALPELLRALREEHRRQEALSAVMSLGDAGAAQPLAELLEDESLGDFDRTLVAAALARFGDERGALHLVARIEHEGDDRPVAAEWAGRLGVQLAVPALGELAETEGDPARGAAMRALGRLKAPGAEERLLAIARTSADADDLRMDAAEGLAELGTPAALELLQMLASEQGELATVCKELLLEIGANAAAAQAAARAQADANAQAGSGAQADASAQAGSGAQADANARSAVSPAPKPGAS